MLMPSAPTIVAVRRAGADQHAEPRLHDQQIKQQRDRQPDDDDGEPIERVGEPGRTVTRPARNPGTAE